MPIKLNQVTQGDCFKLISKVKSGSVDLIICDGPYGVTGNSWDRINDIQTFNLKLIELFAQVLKPGGTLYLFGKANCLDFIDYRPFLTLNARLIWYQPSRLAQGRKNYTNNYDIIAYFSKGKAKTFNLEDIRVPQLVELEQRRRCENVPSVKHGRFNKTKFNVRGKNPGDVWGDIKQLTYRSKELVGRKYLNTIQKPERLIERLVRASSNKGDLVLDPFAGVGTTLLTCRKLKRKFIGFEINAKCARLAGQRIS
ncbi:MAG: site-specific DNA-methyltransferase [Candidatus Margulisbacteria bacterium]|nr:site-specific DNA-methyltransferase [Candidatus Margulisiibacteriota bacterium]